jgi:hypothetical protein
MHPPSARGGPINATPEERVVAMAKKFREAQKAYYAERTPENSRKLRLAQVNLEDAIDKML